MFSRTIRRSIVDVNAALTPKVALPIRARLSTVSNTLEPGNVPEPLSDASGHKSNRTADYSPNLMGSRQTKTPSTPNDSVATPPAPSSAAPLPPPTSTTTPLSDSVKELLPLLKAQEPHYMVAHIHEKAYLVTVGDTVRLPFLMPSVQPGDVLRLNRATVLGSRDFTLRAPPAIKGTREDPGRKMRWVDDRVFTCRATVVGIESEPMRVKEKTKQRNRHVKHAKSKHKYTVLRISEITVKTLDDIEAEAMEMQRREDRRRRSLESRMAKLAEREIQAEASAQARAIEAGKRRVAKKAANSGAKPKVVERVEAAAEAEAEPEKQAA